jgi:hypothetical protein
MARCAHLYVPRSSRDYILAAVAENDTGIQYEQNTTARIPQASPPADLAKQVLHFVGQFLFKHRDLEIGKESDWPAFRASGLRTLPEFERDYECVVVEQNLRGFSMIRLRTSPSAADTVHLPPVPSSEELALGLLQLRERMIQHPAFDTRGPFLVCERTEISEVACDNFGSAEKCSKCFEPVLVRDVIQWRNSGAVTICPTCSGGQPGEILDAL